MKYLKYALKVLNPFIWMWNIFQYFSHLEGQRIESEIELKKMEEKIRQYTRPYDRYDFSRDLKYF